jgi:hypothetical protein
MRIEEVAARMEIQDVLVRASRGVDRGDLEMLQSVYHPGAIDHHGPHDGDAQEFAKKIVELHDSRPGISQHHLTNTLIEFDAGGDTARVETYFLAMLPIERSGEVKFAIGAGRYLDRFALRDGRWLIDERWVVFDWSRDQIAGEEWAIGPMFPAGGTRGDDPSDALFPGRSSSVG